MKGYEVILFLGILFFITSSLALTPAEEISEHIAYGILVCYCSLMFIVGGVSALIIALSAIKLFTTKKLKERKEAKKRFKYALIALIFILIACPFVNYLVKGFAVEEFKCECPPPPKPTTTTTTYTTTSSSSTTSFTTTTATYPPVTLPTTTTSSTLPKTSGGRFLMVGWRGTDIDGAIFNMDGTSHRSQFGIDTGENPIVVATGLDRFFIAFDSYAKMLDWDGYDVSGKFTTLDGYFPVKVIHLKDKFYLLLSPKSGSSGCKVQVYDLWGNLDKEWDVDIERIPYLQYGWVKFPDGGMALGGGDKLFIVWIEKTSATPTAIQGKVYGMIYDLAGNKIKDKFGISNVISGCEMNHQAYVKPNVAAGEVNYMVTAGGSEKLFLYDIATGNFVGTKPAALRCIHDLIYGDGKFLITENHPSYPTGHQPAYFYGEEGNPAGSGEFGGHGDQMCGLAYGNHMFVGVVAIHYGGDGIGISFMDSNGVHVRDALAIWFAECPGIATYDW